MLEKSFNEFQNDFIHKYGEYQLLHQQLNKYRGKEIGNMVEEVNELIEKIQLTYNELFPGITFIVKRYPDITDMVYKFNEFIEDLKKAGAIEITEPHVAR